MTGRSRSFAAENAIRDWPAGSASGRSRDGSVGLGVGASRTVVSAAAVALKDLTSEAQLRLLGEALR